MFLFVILLLSASALQKQLSLFTEKPLEGDFAPAPRPVFSWQGWLKGDFQQQLDQYLNDNNGFNASLIRLNNQLDFSLFREIHADGVVAGKGGHLFEYDYIRSYAGLDFIGEHLIDYKIRRLKFLQGYLKDSLDIDLVFVFEPGKASTLPELIPGHYLKNRNQVNNYTVLKNKAEGYGLHTIDLLSWYPTLRATSPYPLYSQFGIHWSIYGMSLVADSLLNWIEYTRAIDLRDVYTDTVVVEKYARRPDYDMASAMNLMFRMKDRDSLAYPTFRFEADAGEKEYPRVLVVGDSYYWNIYNTQIPRNLFANEAYWYFGKLVYPEFYSTPTYVDDVDVKKVVESQDVIFIMTTERFLYKFDWQFIQRLYSIYGVTSDADRVYAWQDQILNNDEWYKSIIKKAAVKGKTPSEVLREDAIYSMSLHDTLAYQVYFAVPQYEKNIRQDANWLSAISKKAKERNVSLDEMITQDAEYMLLVNHPRAYERYAAIRDMKYKIEADSLLVEQTKQEARYYCIPYEAMLQHKAAQLAN